jgi:hypothetical protein
MTVAELIAKLQKADPQRLVTLALGTAEGAQVAGACAVTMSDLTGDNWDLTIQNFEACPNEIEL